jgi:hypothetical protein
MISGLMIAAAIIPVAYDNLSVLRQRPPEYRRAQPGVVGAKDAYTYMDKDYSDGGRKSTNEWRISG